MAKFQQILVVTLLLTVGCTLSLPVVEEVKPVEAVKSVEPVGIKTNPVSTQTAEKLRQEGDGDGDGADGDPDAPEFAQVGQQVGQIITGALTGNIGGIFGGSTSFIQEEDTKSGVGNILNSITKPFNQLLITGVASGQKFFGITNPPTILVAETTPAPVLGQPGLTGSALPAQYPAQQGVAVQPAVARPVRVTQAPVPLAPKTNPASNPDDDDDELRALLASS